MTKSYFRRITALVPCILSSLSILSKASGYFNGRAYFSNDYNAEHRSWMLPNSCFNKKQPHDTYKKFSKQLFLNKSYEWLVNPPRPKKEGEKPAEIAHYQSEKSIVFDAKNHILALHGTSALTYGNMKLEADVVALHLNTHMISAQGTKDLHNQSVGNPIFTYKDVTKNKYGKDGSTQTRIFFMEKIWYNIETKRALVGTLHTKQEESIVKSKQVKKEDEETFYAEDIIYTTCALPHPHFYIHTKRAKIVQDKQITTGPFRFYFDHVPTPLGYIFGTLFLEGKRTYGVIPPEIGEGDHGFYLRNGGGYINFNDYADVSVLGSIYSSGITELKSELRYKKRYLCSGNVYYANNTTEKEKGWSLKWAHKTLAHGARSFNANVDLHNKSYKTFDYEDKKIPKSMEQQSSASLSYQDQLVGFPYGLTVRAEFKNNLISNFKHWALPKGSLNSSSWYPFRMVRSKGTNLWFHNLQLKHSIDFESHFQNKKKEANTLYPTSLLEVPSTYSWNHYTENGIRHTIPLRMQCKLFEYFNLNPHLTYNEGWYWLKKETKGPIQVPGFNRVYAWHFGAELATTLYCTHYFEEASSVQGFRIKTEPSLDFTYTPDFSKKYFQAVKNKQGEKEEKYAFKGLRPGIDLTNRARSILRCKLHNTVELKVKKETEPGEKAKEEKKRTSRKIFLLKNLDFETKYDFKAEKFHLTDGIQMHIASEAKVGEMGKIGFDLTTNFDPYLSKDSTEDDGDTIPINNFAWNHGQYLGKVKQARFKVNIDLAHDWVKKKKKKKELFNERDHLAHKIEENKIDFEVPWTFSSEFNLAYDKPYKYGKLYKYVNLYQDIKAKKGYNIEQYITFNGGITLVKKWKVSLRTTYNFTKNALDPSTTEISIQRDLHCWQLSYQWYPLGDSAKYDFSLGVKANVLKVLKLPRKRSYNKLS